MTPLKILYIANNRLPTEKAHGLQIVKTCEALIKSGVRVRLVIPRRHQPKAMRTRDLAHYYGLNARILITRVPCLDLLLLRSRFKWPEKWGVVAYWLQSFTFYSGATVAVLFRRGILYSRDLSALLPFVVLHRAFFFEAHNFPKTFFGKKLYRMVLRRVRGVVVITEQLKKLYEEEFKLDPRKVVVASDGVDLDMFKEKEKIHARRTLKFSAQSVLVVYTGNLYEWKGVYTLVEAMAFLKTRAQCVVVGGDSHDGAYEKLAAFAQGKGIHNLIMTGHVPPPHIPDYLACADVLVLPNSGRTKLSAAYTSPLKLFEYMASGRPIVASEVPALQEVLDRTTAVWFKPDDAKDLARAVDRLLSNPDIADCLAQRAKQRVRAYTWEKRAQKIREFLLSQG